MEVVDYENERRLQRDNDDREDVDQFDKDKETRFKESCEICYVILQRIEIFQKKEKNLKMVIDMLEEIEDEDKFDVEYLGKIMVNKLVFTKEVMKVFQRKSLENE